MAIAIFFLAPSGCQYFTPDGKPTDKPNIEATSIPTVETPKTSILDRVKARGKLICGVNGQLPGFSIVNDAGEWSGFDVDFCRAIAAAVLGDPQAVEYKTLSVQQRFTALQTGEIDVMLRNTTWTLSRDTENAIDFAPPTFYDGQGLMVKLNNKSSDPKKSEESAKDQSAQSTPTTNSEQKTNDANDATDPNTSESEQVKTLQGKKICVETGISESNLGVALKKANVEFTTIVAIDANAVYSKYAKGECDAVSSEKSQLAAWRSKLPQPSQHKIISVVFSKEPLSPAIVNNDPRWYDVVKWVIYSTFYAEELGINQKNFGTFKDTENPEIARFLGTSEALGIKLGLAPDWTTQVLKAVGNYSDIYTRNLEPLGLPRGLNQTWDKGGLLYSMPFR